MLYLELFLTFFKIGLFTIGGGYAMLPLIQADVQAKGWMTAEELVNFIAVSEEYAGPLCGERLHLCGGGAGGPARRPSAPRWGWCCPPSSSSCWWPGSTPPSAPAPSSAAPWADCVRR